MLLLLSAIWIGEKQQIPILQSLIWPDQGSDPQSTALEESMLTITPPKQFRLVHVQDHLKKIVHVHLTAKYYEGPDFIVGYFYTLTIINPGLLLYWDSMWFFLSGREFLLFVYISMLEI
jgi:hypothetical protein